MAYCLAEWHGQRRAKLANLSPWLGVSAFVFLVVLVLMARVPGLFVHFWDWDEAAMMAESWAMTKGQHLYVDVLQIHPVLQFALMAPFFYVLPAEWVPLAIKTMNLILVFLGALLIARIAFEWLRSRTLGVLAATLFTFNCSNTWSWSSHGEFYSMFPILLSAWFLYFVRSPIAVVSYLTGVLWTMAFFLKQVALFDALGLYLAYLIVDRAPRHVKARTTVGICLGGLTVTVGIGAWLFAQGSLSAAWSSMFVRPLYYARPAEGNALFLLRWATAPTTQLGFCFPTLLGITSIIVARRKQLVASPEGTSFLIALFVWLGFDLVGLYLAGRFYPHYMLQLVPSVSLLPLFILRQLGARAPRAWRLSPHAFLAVLAVSLFAQFAGEMWALSGRPWVLSQVRRSTAVAEFIKAHTRENERIFLYKTDNLDIFFLSQRLSNNGVYMFVDMASEHLRDQAEQDRRRKAFLAHLPALIVVDPDYDTRGMSRDEVRNFKSLDFFDRVLGSRYIRGATVEGLEVWMRASP